MVKPSLGAFPQYHLNGAHRMSIPKADIVQIITPETGLPKNRSGHMVERYLYWSHQLVAINQDDEQYCIESMQGYSYADQSDNLRHLDSTENAIKGDRNAG